MKAKRKINQSKRIKPKMLAVRPNRFLDLQLTLRDICKVKRQIVNKGRCSAMACNSSCCCLAGVSSF